MLKFSRDFRLSRNAASLYLRWPGRGGKDKT